MGNAAMIWTSGRRRLVAVAIGAMAVGGIAAAGRAQDHGAAMTGGAMSGGDVTLLISHVRDATGHVRVDLCTADTFLKAHCPYSGAAVAVQGVTTVIVANVPPGSYAAQVYHDRNDNHTVDRGALGIPLEEIGFSQDAPVGLHGPRFAKAAFVHGDDDQTLSVKLRRFR